MGRTTASESSPGVGEMQEHVQLLEDVFEQALELLLPEVDAILSELESRLPPEATISPSPPPAEAAHPSHQSARLQPFSAKKEKSKKTRSSNSASNSHPTSNSRKRAEPNPTPYPLSERNCSSSKNSPGCLSAAVHSGPPISSSNEVLADSQMISPSPALPRSITESPQSRRGATEHASAHSSVSFRVSTRTSVGITAALRSNGNETSAASVTSHSHTPTSSERVTTSFPSSDATSEVDRAAVLLLRAAKGGKLEDVLATLETGTDINSRDDSGKTALHLAAWNGHADIVALLLTNGADASNSGNTGAYTPLHVASFAGHAQCVAFLLDFGVEVDSKSKNGSTALHMAALNGHETIVQLLVAAGASREITDESGKTAFEMAQTVAIRELLLL